MKNHPGIPQKSNIEDVLALKKLVDTFSNLADVKDVKSQMDLLLTTLRSFLKQQIKPSKTKEKKKSKNHLLIT